MEISVIDEHVEAFILWERAKRKGIIHPTDSLLHVDSHEDINYPSILKHSLFDIEDVKTFTEDNLASNTFIVPAAPHKCFSSVYCLHLIDCPGRIMRKRIQKYYNWSDQGFYW